MGKKNLVFSNIALEVLSKKIKVKHSNVEFSFIFDQTLSKFLSEPSFDADNVFILFDSYTTPYDASQMELLHTYIKDKVQNHRDQRFVFINTPSLNLSSITSQNFSSNLTYQRVNWLADTQRSNHNFYVADLTSRFSLVGLNNCYNFNLGYLYQMPYTLAAQDLLADLLYDWVRFFSNSEKKVIVVDCDNTLWHGVLGEDGVDGLFYDSSPKGAVHFNLQKFLKQKKEEGFLLAISSKNNYDEVYSFFEKTNSTLKWDDFVAHRINWDAKSQNIVSITQELNLGLESIIFIDDSPVEIEEVKSVLPEVKCLLFNSQQNPLHHWTVVTEFWKKRLSSEDLTKTEQYLVEKERTSLLSKVTDRSDYVTSLELVPTLSHNPTHQLSRLSQLTEKTNQFNFNKVPYSEQELADFMNAGNHIYSLSLKDKFGDYGIIGLILYNKEGWFLENFLLSCRALGRGVENVFLNLVKDDLSQKGLEVLGYRFTETPRNYPAKEFIQKNLTNLNLLGNDKT